MRDLPNRGGLEFQQDSVVLPEKDVTLSPGTTFISCFFTLGDFAGGPATGPFPVNSASEVTVEPADRRPQEV